MATNIFGYGSLLNTESRRRVFTELSMNEDVVLSGYQRILNAGHEDFDYLAMNLTLNESMSVKGHVFSVSEADMPALLEREIGYDLVDISDQVSVQLSEPVFAFIMHKTVNEGKEICEKYLGTCLRGVPAHEHDQWIKETIILKNK